MTGPPSLQAARVRAWPFRVGQTADPDALADGLAGLPDGVVLDLGVELLSPGYDPAAHAVWLAGVAPDADDLVFTVESDAPGCETPLVFRLPADSPPYTGVFSEGAFAALPGGPPPGGPGLFAPGLFAPDAFGPALYGPAPAPGAAAVQPGWWGYLVLGDPAGAAGRSGRCELEWACVTPAPAVERFDLYAEVRPDWDAGSPCREAEEPGDDGPVLAAVGTLAGPDVLWGDGLNLATSAGAAGLGLRAAVGAGLGEPCGPAGSGGPRCRETLRTLAGAPGPAVAVVAAGGGYAVTPDPAGHTLTLSLDPAGRGAGCAAGEPTCPPGGD